MPKSGTRFHELDVIHVLILNVLTFTVAVAWSDLFSNSVKSLLNSPDNQLWAMLIYALVLSVTTVILAYHWNIQGEDPLEID